MRRDEFEKAKRFILCSFTGSYDRVFLMAKTSPLMKAKLILAVMLLMIGVLEVSDWILFVRRREIAMLSFEVVKEKYYDKLPDLLKPLFPTGTTLIDMALFTVAGILFVSERKRVYLGLGIFSFILAFWMLFTLM